MGQLPSRAQNDSVSDKSLVSIVKDPDSGYWVQFEDDAKAAYAYLHDGHKIVGDVWLYNCGDAPETPEWKLPDARSRLPFTNPVGYVKDEAPPVVRKASDVSCSWVHDSNGLVEVDLFIHGTLFARLKPGSKPGWSRLASRDGPNARVLKAG
jgi:hypothetical protein